MPMQMSTNNGVASKIAGGFMFGLTLTGSMFTGVDHADAKSGQSPYWIPSLLDVMAFGASAQRHSDSRSLPTVS